MAGIDDALPLRRLHFSQAGNNDFLDLGRMGHRRYSGSELLAVNQ
jgi:hypothetical protein